MRLIFIIVLVTAFASASFAAPVHDFHTTFMTIEQNPDEKILEITVKIFTHDLVPTLERRLNKNIDLGATEGLDDAIFAYINERFEIKTSDGVVLPSKWVGKEVEAQVVMVYMETPFGDELVGAAVSNSLFFESYNEQINYVSFKFGEHKTDLVFKVGDKEKAVAWREGR